MTPPRLHLVEPKKIVEPPVAVADAFESVPTPPEAAAVAVAVPVPAPGNIPTLIIGALILAGIVYAFRRKPVEVFHAVDLDEDEEDESEEPEGESEDGNDDDEAEE